MERLCINCKHFKAGNRYPGTPDRCHAMDGKQHPVYGGDVGGIDPGLMRMTLCGWNDPKFWERKPPATVSAA